MATSLAVFFAATLCLGAIRAESFKSQAFESRLPGARGIGVLDLSVKGECSALSCSEGSSGAIEYSYGKTGRGGKFEVVYQDDGSVVFNSEATGGNTLLKTVIAVGDDPKCEFTASSVPLTFDQCGFHHFTDGVSIGRTILVKVRHQFASGVDGVHFFGGKDISVKVVLTKKDPETVLIATPAEIKEDDIHECSALNHSLTALPSKKSNLWTFEVRPENYKPTDLGVGFDLQSCVAKPYLIGSNELSQNPLHHFRIISEGKYIGSANQLVEQEVTPGQYYKVAVTRYSPAYNVPDVDKLDVHRPSVVSCSICLCTLPDVPAKGDEEPKLRACPTYLRNSSPSTLVKSSWVEDSAGQDIQAGNVNVVQQPIFPF